jgi:hypothetical protein
MSPATFYDLSFEEWADAMDGYLGKIGAPRYPRAADFAALAHRVGPSASVRRN